MTLEHGRVLAELHLATDRFADLVASAVGEEPVPTCPGWTVRDLALHLGSIHRWAAAIVLSGHARLPVPEPNVAGSLTDWYRGSADALLAVVAVIDPAEPTPNFAQVRETAGFWSRRQLHETTVHAVDAALALGVPESEWGVSPDVAVDGVEEVLGVFFPRMTARGSRPEVHGRVRFEPDDHREAHVVTPDLDPTAAPVLLVGAEEWDTTIRGSASDLYLGLWGRVSHDRLAVDDAAGHAVLAGPTVP